MHPAPSIILFSTLSGAGFGMMIWLGAGFGPSSRGFAFFACGLALALATAGLFASLWHLGNPRRAWRALSQWRSSWLSREGIFSIAALACFGIYALLWAAGQGRFIFPGVCGAMFALATIYATSMIYAGIEAVPRWSKSPTPALFVAYATAGGGLGVTVAALPFTDPPLATLAVSAALLIAAAAVALWWRMRAAAIGLDADGSTPETAIGLPALGRARLFESPHSSPNYLFKEMVFRIGRKHADKLRRLAFGAAFILPLLLLGIAAAMPSWSPVLWLALPVHLAGVAASRWLFFAEAEHVVSLYYGYR
ncbi:MULTISPECIES: DmsC/YnfH family molybdoenzyme membrane anchor subunit [Rhodomicrobium]|uniref:dimethyl sulfoxide reductase anchor subunit family protein n=1 Tax=Rhodomicrobium TaxID=1068 RepID=UPI000B4BC920|nr:MULTISPECIES: DmsC/YnfH family molybdoenzyme membrane anchor subunit [Rhodomicrobium]